MLRALKSDIAELKSFVLKQQNSKYDCFRTKKSNLKVIFGNGDKYHFPVIPFRPYQLIAQEQLFLERKKRLFEVLPRRAGKEVETWNMLIQSALTDPGLYIMVYPTTVRGRMILWDGAMTLPDGSSLKFRDMIPDRFKLKKDNHADMKIEFINGSIIRIVGSDIDPQKLRGINARGAVFAEFAFSDPRVLQALMPVFTQNKGWFILQTTYNGMNHAYRLMQNVKNDPEWFCRVESVDTLRDENGNRYITDEMIDADRRSGMPEWMIQQEYYSVVEINHDTLYFANEVKYLDENNKIILNAVIPNRPIRAFYDIGWNDSTAITMAQTDDDGKPRIVNYFENRNKTLQYYVQECRTFANRHNLLLHSHYVPHDGQKHDFNTGKNTIDFGTELGEKFILVPKPTSKFNAIQSMRQMLYRCTFDKQNTTRLIECLSNYSKVYDEKHGIYKEQPLHDWTCHGVDSFQTLTLAYDAQLVNDNHFKISYYNT